MENYEDEIARLKKIEDAARVVYDGLMKRVEDAPKNAVPVFNGISELHTALNQ